MVLGLQISSIHVHSVTNGSWLGVGLSMGRLAVHLQEYHFGKSKKIVWQNFKNRDLR